MRRAVNRMWAAFALLAALLALGGCQTTPWIRGSVDEGQPKIAEPFPRDVAFYVDRTEKRVQGAFERALRDRGFTVVDKEEACDVVLRATLLSWEYNQAGFAGFGRRDDMEISVVLSDRRHGRVLARANISLRSDFRIIAKYVEKF